MTVAARTGRVMAGFFTVILLPVLGAEWAADRPATTASTIPMRAQHRPAERERAAVMAVTRRPAHGSHCVCLARLY